jgi:signal transduction histidine kinase
LTLGCNAGAMRGTRRRASYLAAAALAVSSVAIAVAAVVLVRTNWQRREPGVFGWTVAETVFFTAGWASVVAAECVGLWLWWRDPRARTGFWLWLAGAALGLWFIGTYWPNPWGTQFTFAIYAFRPALAMAILGWPTGRPTRQIGRWILALAVLYPIEGLVGTLFAGPVEPHWPENPLTRFDVPWVEQLLGSIGAWLLLFFPAVVVIIVLVRQRRALPPAAAGLVTPVMVAGVIVAATDLITVVLTSIDPSLLFDNASHHETLIGTVVLTQNYAQGALAALGLAIASQGRNRVVRSVDRIGHIDLGRPTAATAPSNVLSELLSDPSARAIYPIGEGRWIDAAGEPVVLDHRTRRLTPVVGEDDGTIAIIDSDADVTVHPMLMESASATVLSRLMNERAYANARARELELVGLQHAILDASDNSRRRLERDLHDGAQQRLVGLALSARLLERTPTSEGRIALRTEVLHATEELRGLLDDALPSVLTLGLSAGLTTLAATSPVPVRLRVDDVAAADPLTITIWFIANEGVANAVKHAEARQIEIDVMCGRSEVRLVVRDDGRGGAPSAPPGIITRVAEAGGTLTFVSPPGRGTTIDVTLPHVWGEGS